MVGPTLFASSKLPLKSMIIAKFVKCWHWHSVAVSDVDTSRHPSELQEFWATSQKTHVGSKSENIRKFNYSQHISQLVSLQPFICFLPDMFFFLSIVHKWSNLTLTSRFSVIGSRFWSYRDDPIIIEFITPFCGSLMFKLLTALPLQMNHIGPSLITLEYCAGFQLKACKLYT